MPSSPGCVPAARFRDRRVPWSQLGKLDEDDPRAIYRYLRTVPPVENDPGRSLTAAR